jgi:hypothetical protein
MEYYVTYYCRGYPNMVVSVLLLWISGFLPSFILHLGHNNIFLTEFKYHSEK